MPTLTLIRHAPTVSNDSGIFMGSLDIPSSDESLRAACELGVALAHTEFTKYYSSPMLRARQSAEAIFPHAPVMYDKNLIERDLGSWGGKTKAAVRAECPQAFYPSGTMNPFFTPPAGEPLQQVIDRVKVFLDQVVQLEDDARIVAVTHNGIIRVIRCLIELRPFEQIFVEHEPHLEPRTYPLDKRRWLQAHDYFEQLGIVDMRL